MLHLLSNLPLTDPADSGGPDLSWLGPAVLATGSVLVALIGILSLIIKSRQDRKAAKSAAEDQAEIAVQPKVTDGWEEVRAARLEATKYYNLYRAFEDLYYVVSSALRHLARNVRDAHPEQVFDKDIAEALAVVPPETDVPKK